MTTSLNRITALVLGREAVQAAGLSPESADAQAFLGILTTADAVARGTATDDSTGVHCPARQANLWPVGVGEPDTPRRVFDLAIAWDRITGNFSDELLHSLTVYLTD